MKKVYQSHLFFSFFNKTFIVAIFLMLVGSAGFAQATYTWKSAGTDWTIATNWIPDRSSVVNTDILIFNNGATNTVTNVPTETIGQLVVNGTNTIVNLQAGSPGNVLTIGYSSSLGITVTTGCELNINGTNALTLFTSAIGSPVSTVSGSMTFTNGNHKLDGAVALNFISPAVFTQGLGCTGSVFSSGIGGSVLNFAVFNTGSTFIQKDGGDPFGTTAAPNAKTQFNTGSLFKLQQNVVPTFVGRVYANFEIDQLGYAQTFTTGAGAINVDNLTITQGSLTINSVSAGVNVRGNIFVAAGQTLALNSNTLRLNGTLSPQTIVNNGTLTFGAAEPVIINNSNGITVNSDITFNNTVTFTDGVVTVNSTNVLTFGTNATHANVGNGRYVDGKVKKVDIGVGGFIFPVGKVIAGVKSYVPLTVSNLTLTNSGDNYTVEYKRGNLNSTAIGVVGLKVVSSLDYWTLDRSVTNPASTADIKLQWTLESSNNGSTAFITLVSAIVVAHYNGTNWDAYGNTSMASGGVVSGDVVWPACSNLSATNKFAIGSIDFANPLPITVNYINGTKQNGTHLLNWQVSCVNNLSAKMIVERSADNKNFTAVNTVTATALRCQQPFDYTDAAPLPGINYYRLKTINDDGKVSYSTTIVLLNKQSGFDMVSLLPNVVTANAVLNIAAAQKTKLNIVITDIAGRQVQQASYSLVAGSNQFEINVASLAAGTYQITGYTAEGLTKTLRFVKQ